jgi:hypothetical protein
LVCFWKEVEKRGLQVAVAGIPKTIDNDIAVSCVIHSAILCLKARFDFQGFLLFFKK